MSLLKTGNRVFVDGVEKFDVTVTIIDGHTVVTPNPGAQAQGNGPLDDSGDGGPPPPP